MYHERKEWLEGQLEAESSRLNNQARFIMEKIEGKVSEMLHKNLTDYMLSLLEFKMKKLLISHKINNYKSLYL